MAGSLTVASTAISSANVRVLDSGQVGNHENRDKFLRSVSWLPAYTASLYKTWLFITPAVKISSRIDFAYVIHNFKEPVFLARLPGSRSLRTILAWHEQTQ
jgi:hypothetical protein